METPLTHEAEGFNAFEELLLVKEEILRRPRKPHSSVNPPLKERDCARAYRSREPR